MDVIGPRGRHLEEPPPPAQIQPRHRDDNVADSVRLLEAAAGLVSDDTGMAIDVRAAAQSPGQAQLELPLHYSRGGAGRQALPAVRVHLTFDEPVLFRPETLIVSPTYAGLESFQITAYSLLEIAAEKLRALLQQQEKWPRPRDLYDLWFILCERSEPIVGTQLHALFELKCAVRDVRPDVSRLTSATLKEWNREAWITQLAPMMKAAPDYDRVWADWLRTSAGLR